MKILAIDQGTTSTRALLHGDDGVLRPVMQRAHLQIRPAPGHVEHDPEEILGHIAAAIDSSGADLVGIANQGESCLAWDAQDGRAISPVIVWQDDRTAGITDALRRAGAGPEVQERAGLPLDPYFSASKLGWIMAHVPRAAELHRMGRLRLGTTDAFFRDRLTGRHETDIATASRTSLMDLSQGCWDETLCEIFGVPVNALPRITENAGDLGRIGDGPILAASIVDQQAALYGHGCRSPGMAKLTLGTGAFVQCLTGELLRPARPGPLPTVAWQLPGEAVSHALDGAVYAAAAAVDWARSLGLFAEYDQIARFAGEAAIDRGLVFLPALSGLACPHWDRRARGAWIGLGLEHGPADMMQAVLEGIALRVAEAVQAMAELQPIAGLSVDGGMARNDYLLGFLAGLLGQPVRRAAEVESTALGLVHMAMAGQGMSPPQPVAADPIPSPPHDAERAARRMAQFGQVREALSALARSRPDES
ncbi:glycerol kinase [Paracoccus isoporae]|uniref:ATP:glycerol 3-phosphotransferase n=1 Tax=Paracoccus isoporae TaxID=591205 RepID=A0A1G7F871_9RHOB|nr:FGGY family carbohydrate kinase [Paracoccus isoporae]SDE72026.1 glycerol kinase [Paracoccus isoporae]